MKTILKILIAVAAFALFNQVNLHAESYNMLKKLYVVLGSSDTLEYPGYRLIETDINYNQPGSYNATYQEDITDRKFTREIEVVSSYDLINNGIKNVNLKEEYEFENSKVLKRITTSNYSVFVVEQDDDVKLCYLYNGEFENITIFNKNDFNFIDLVYSKEHNKLYLTGTIYNNTLDIYIAEYGLNGVLLKEKIIKGSNVDLVKSIVVTTRAIFLCGSTTSNDQDFTHTSYQEDSYIIKLDIDTFEISKYLNLGEVGIDYLELGAYLDALYAIKHFYTSGVHVVKIYKFDDNLNIIDSTYLGTITFVSDINLKMDNNNLYYFCSVFNEKLNDDEQVLYKISQNLSIKKLDTYYDEYSIGVDLNIVNNEISLLYTSYSKEENYPTYIRIISDSVKKFTLDNRIYDKCYFNELGNLDLLYNNKLKSFEYSLVYAKTLGSSVDLENSSPIIMCNTMEIKENKYLSNTLYDKEIFGNYELLYYYNFDFFDLVYQKTINVKSDVIIDNNNIYTDNLVLNFKGVGYLNDLLIESGYVINDIGLYNLVIIGNNNLKEIYNFEIVKNTSSKEELMIKNNNINLSIPQTNEEDFILESRPPINNIISKDYQSNIWYIVIPVLTLIISVSLFTMIGRKIK